MKKITWTVFTVVRHRGRLYFRQGGIHAANFKCISAALKAHTAVQIVKEGMQFDIGEVQYEEDIPGFVGLEKLLAPLGKHRPYQLLPEWLKEDDKVRLAIAPATVRALFERSPERWDPIRLAA